MEISLDRVTSPAPHDHVVQFYEDESFLADSVATFLAAGLKQDRPAIVIATEAHRRAFLKNLKRKHAVDGEKAMASGQLSMLDARDMINGFMVGGMPDAALVKVQLGGLLAGILANYPGQRLCAYGEMVDVLWRDNNAHAAIRLEELWNELAGMYSFSLLCAYAVASFSRSTNGVGFQDICRTHGHVIPAESYRETWTAPERHHAVTDLQVRAAASATEVEQRKVLEHALRRALAARRAAEQELAALRADTSTARETLDRTQQATTEWLMEAVHGLRSPLNAILGWTQMVKLTQQDAATMQQAIEVIERNAESLNRLVSGLLEPRRGSGTSTSEP